LDIQRLILSPNGRTKLRFWGGQDIPLGPQQRELARESELRASPDPMGLSCPARSPGAVPSSHRSALRLERKPGPVRCLLPVCVAHRRHGGQSTGAKGAQSASAVPIGAKRRPLGLVRRSVVPAMGDANGRFRARKARLGRELIPLSALECVRRAKRASAGRKRPFARAVS
jgi:hypothetical protein